MTTQQLRIFSSGGGVQSTAALILSARREIDFPIHIFANVGNDSERSETLHYVHEIAMPYAEAHGIQFHEVAKTKRDGSTETIYGRIMRPGSKSQNIPVYLDKSGAPGNRSCTTDFKIKVIAKVQKAMGATKENPCVTGLGISIDEFQRMKTDSGIAWQVLVYPLIDLRLTRQDCLTIIQREGLPIPPKSSCWFCPFTRLTEWQRMKRQQPDLFKKAVALEARLNEVAALRNDHVWLTRKLKPLDEAVGDQLDMFEPDDTCESGFCMT